MSRAEPGKVHRLRAFTRAGAGGNPAGVVLDAGGLGEKELQRIASETGAPETAFVSESSRADFRLRFFTPAAEVDLCGHATVAAFHHMLRAGRIAPGGRTQETRAGLFRVEVGADGGVLMEQREPEFFEELGGEEIAKALRVPAAWISETGLPPQIVSTGLRDILVPLADRRKLVSMRPDPEALRKLTWSCDVIGLHAFTLDARDPAARAHSRNFAPLYGIPEEPATGTSTGALACYLARRGLLPAGGEAVFEQGDSMGQPSEIRARVEGAGGRITGIWVGGAAVAEEA